jgi:hypothetical protein
VARERLLDGFTVTHDFTVIGDLVFREYEAPSAEQTLLISPSACHPFRFLDEIFPRMRAGDEVEFVSLSDERTRLRGPLPATNSDKS